MMQILQAGTILRESKECSGLLQSVPRQNRNHGKQQQDRESLLRDQTVTYRSVGETANQGEEKCKLHLLRRILILGCLCMHWVLNCVISIFMRDAILIPYL